MNIFKSVFAGILIGATLFFMPFFFVRFILFFLVTGAVIRFLIGRRFRGGFRRQSTVAFADNIRKMSEAEYNNFKQRFNQRSDGFGQGNRFNETTIQ